MNARLAHDVVGRDGAPWLLLGGSLGTVSGMWDEQVPVLAEHFRVVRYEHRGHGGSEAPPGPYTIEALGRDVLALADGLGIAEFAYCGLSMGAMIGMWLAANAPQRVTRLALCCTTAHMESAEAWTARAAATRAEGTAGIARTVVARWFTPRFAAARPDVVERCVEWMSAVSDEGYAGCCEAIAAMDLRADLTRITAPTLVIAGGEDVAAPVGYARLIAACVPNAGLEVLDRAGHLANLEFPEQVTSLLLGHLVPCSGGDRDN